MAENRSSVVSVGDLNISQKHTTIIVEPTAFADGFDKDAYDTAELSTLLWVENPEERWVEIPLPFATENFSASVSVISAGPDEYRDRIFSVSQIRNGFEKYIPYLRHLGTSEELLGNKKALRNILKGMRVAMVKLPAGNLVVKIQCSQIIKKDPDDMNGKTFSFKAFAPLPSFFVKNAAPLKLHVIFKDVDTISREIETPTLSYPFGDIPTVDSQETTFGGDKLYYWKWQNDPVVEFKYRYL
ncbi:MAG: hypothetical protein Q4F02_00470 [Candidatus Saccharibacteria bacterium]|nr:hypothetical protein [Candidatus Saccharibacteria bacterium]